MTQPDLTMFDSLSERELKILTRLILVNQELSLALGDSCWQQGMYQTVLTMFYQDAVHFMACLGLTGAASAVAPVETL